MLLKPFGTLGGEPHSSIWEKIPSALHVALPWQPNGHLKSLNVTAFSISTIPPILSFQTFFPFPSLLQPDFLSPSPTFTAAISGQAPANSLLLFLPSKSLRSQSVSGIFPLFSLFFIGFEHRNTTSHSISGLGFAFFYCRRFIPNPILRYGPSSESKQTPPPPYWR